jgi:hypothetical protein
MRGSFTAQALDGVYILSQEDNSRCNLSSAFVMLMNISSATLKQVASAVCGLHNT